MLEGETDQNYINSLLKINYIGNVCLIMELDRSLSSYYWLNVNDPSFPFVGIIEHTNLVDKALYGNRHIVYLSKYLPTTDHIYKMDTEEFLDYATPYIQKMFPDFERSWIKKANLWKAQYSQPIVEKFYSATIPEMKTPVSGLYLSTMAQIYPEDRGTNYAVQYGQKVAELVKHDL
jgi:protoporphyrinogen oxidase